MRTKKTLITHDFSAIINVTRFHFESIENESKITQINRLSKSRRTACLLCLSEHVSSVCPNSSRTHSDVVRISLVVLRWQWQKYNNFRGSKVILHTHATHARTHTHTYVEVMTTFTLLRQSAHSVNTFIDTTRLHYGTKFNFKAIYGQMESWNLYRCVAGAQHTYRTASKRALCQERPTRCVCVCAVCCTVCVWARQGESGTSGAALLYEIIVFTVSRMRQNRSSRGADEFVVIKLRCLRRYTVPMSIV